MSFVDGCTVHLASPRCPLYRVRALRQGRRRPHRHPRACHWSPHCCRSGHGHHRGAVQCPPDRHASTTEPHDPRHCHDARHDAPAMGEGTPRSDQDR